MALVSNNPGGENGVLGVITLEDVIEELIGEVLFWVHANNIALIATSNILRFYRKS